MKEVVVLGIAALLLVRMTNQQRLVSGNVGRLPAANQNSDMWLKAGGLQLGRDLLREWLRGSAVSAPAVSSGSEAVFDGWTGTGDYSADSGGYW